MRQFSSPTARAGRTVEPVIPLPNVGEGGPVYPGNMNNGVTDPGQEPVIPLPNPGEGGPVYPGDMDGGSAAEPEHITLFLELLREIQEGGGGQ